VRIVEDRVDEGVAFEGFFAPFAGQVVGRPFDESLAAVPAVVCALSADDSR
jgi:hypothetical protein